MIYVLFLLMVTAVWGWTFVLVKDALTHYPTLPFLQLRFILAFLVMVVLVRRLPTRREAWVGLLAGAVLAAGYLTQTVGLTITSPGNSGLITGLFVVFTPLIDRIFGVRLFWWTLIAVATALAGTVMLVGGPAGFGLGDLLTIACAFLFALHIVLLSHWSPGLRSAPLAMLQMGTSALIFSAGGSWSLQLPSPDVWLAIAVTGVFASALAFYIQTWAQQHLSASRTALILTTEPAWALVAAVVLAGQRFGPLQAVGAGLVLAAIVGHEVAHLKFKAHGDEAKT
ncbi:MAG TPA: DMT family transporter [Candidatus Dormibacteraeota bacterium]|nr:DMT family transporter [Candidatus Dormibacteraeota bacterium]